MKPYSELLELVRLQNEERSKRQDEVKEFFDQLIKEQRMKFGHYEVNEFGPECP